jgi:hypothetical protein
VLAGHRRREVPREAGFVVRAGGGIAFAAYCNAEVVDVHRVHRIIGCLLVAALVLGGRPAPAAAAASAKKIAADASAALRR